MTYISNTDSSPAISCLPPEMLSEIFKFYCESFIFPLNQAPLVIGGVCRLWREVTLETPQLWTKFNISADSSSEKPYDLETAADWLSRSGSLPLCLIIELVHQEFSLRHKDDPTLAIIDLLRSHSARWEDVVIDSVCNPFVAHLLFNNLDQVPPTIECLDISSSDHYTLRGPGDMNQILLPKCLRVHDNSTLLGLSLGWTRLTSLDVYHALHFDELVHIIENAPNLEDCNVTRGVLRGLGLYKLPKTPIIHRALRCLRAVGVLPSIEPEEQLLDYLTLPSLETLRYENHISYATYDDNDISSLRSFLDRSSPTLTSFALVIKPYGPENYVMFPCYSNPLGLTSLEFDTSKLRTNISIGETKYLYGHISEKFYNNVFPHLEEIVFKVSPTYRFWEFLGYFLEHIQELHVSQPRHSERKPLLGTRFLSVIVEYPGVCRILRQPQRFIGITALDQLRKAEEFGLVVTLRDGSISHQLLQC